MERDLCRDGCVGVNLERKDEYLEQQLQRQRQKRISIIKMVELAAIDERQEDKERSMLKDVLKQLREEREED